MAHNWQSRAGSANTAAPVRSGEPVPDQEFSPVPTYQYACTNPEGKHEFEVVQSFTDAPVSVCPECGSPVRKVYGSVGVVFKGSGFYRTDSRKAASASETASSKPSADGSASSKPAAGSASSSSPSSSAPSTSSSSTSAGSGSKAAN
jgi:putative FmdB family regulatory protein